MIFYRLIVQLLIDLLGDLKHLINSRPWLNKVNFDVMGFVDFMDKELELMFQPFYNDDFNWLPH